MRLVVRVRQKEIAITYLEQYHGPLGNYLLSCEKLNPLNKPYGTSFSLFDVSVKCLHPLVVE